uniref:Uncharacterized protein n=1 Tax=Anguilla anguilla TaxID=7936 RepID=A0A0E9Y195_ANGAN
MLYSETGLTHLRHHCCVASPLGDARQPFCARTLTAYQMWWGSN